MEDFKYLVFGGGGASGFAYIGALEQLSKEPEFSFEKIQAVAGSSIGALTALAISLKYTPQEAAQMLNTLDLKKIPDGGTLISQMYRLFSKYGKYNNEALHEFVKKVLEDKTGRKDTENITFADLKNLGFKDLYIVATKLFNVNNVPKAKEKIFSFETTPNTSVAAAIWASTTAPYYFTRIRLKKIEKGKYVLDENGDLFEDGGLIDNFPVDIFDKPKFMGLPEGPYVTKITNPYTLGFALRDTEKMNDSDHKPIKTPIQDFRLFQFMQGLVYGLVYQTENAKLDKRENRNRTIQITDWV